ncbi:MAG: hypothetical protein WED82_12100 [Balneolales bacterium]
MPYPTTIAPIAVTASILKAAHNDIKYHELITLCEDYTTIVKHNSILIKLDKAVQDHQVF